MYSVFNNFTVAAIYEAIFNSGALLDVTWQTFSVPSFLIQLGWWVSCLEHWQEWAWENRAVLGSHYDQMVCGIAQ